MGTTLVQKSADLPGKTEKQTILNGSNDDFVKVDLGKKELKPGEKLQIECFVPIENSLVDYWLISEKPGSSSFVKYQLNSQSFRIVKKEDTRTTLELEIPTTIPSGNYFARVDLLSPENLALQGGCSTGSFNLINDKPLVESADLISPIAKSELIPKAVSPYNLLWEISGQKSVSLLTPKLVIHKIGGEEKAFFEKDYPVISFPSAGKEKIATSLSDFNQSGAFRIRLELYDESRTLVSISPEQEVFFGIAPGLNGLEDISLSGKVWQAKLLLDTGVVADPSLYIRVVVADENSAKCGQTDYNLNQGWPPLLRVDFSSSKNCQASEAEVHLRMKGIFDHSLDIFRERLPI